MAIKTRGTGGTFALLDNDKGLHILCYFGKNDGGISLFNL